MKTESDLRAFDCCAFIFVLIISEICCFGQILETIYSFSNVNGATPNAALTLGPEGNYYGTTSGGGRFYLGTIFRITRDGTLTTLVSFDKTNGANPKASLTLGSDGNLYGTTADGGVVNSLYPSGMGTVFKVTTNGVLTSLAYFNQTNGAHPWAGLRLGDDGTFYGTTLSGGMTNMSLPQGHGTVFRFSTNGGITSLVQFQGTNGYEPVSDVAFGSDGNLYGTTFGGINGTSPGTLFKSTTSGFLTTLLVFGSTNGITGNPLTLGPDGNLYGTTSAMLYKLDTNGVVTPMLSLKSTNRMSFLTFGVDGALYGIGNSGIFRISTDWTINKLLSFDGTNGLGPNASLSLTDDGNFCGTTSSGGSFNGGTAFRVTTNGELTTIVSFDGINGAHPEAGLTVGDDGSLYGTTYSGGIGYGTVYKVDKTGFQNTLVYFPFSNGPLNPSSTLTMVVLPRLCGQVVNA